MTRKQFDKWVEKMVEKYQHERFFSACEIHVVKNVVICADHNHNVGIAKCHPDDEFNVLIGIAIAYARCKGIEIPKINVYKKLSEMKNGDIFYGVCQQKFIYIGKNEKIERYVIWDTLLKKYYEFYDTDTEYRMVD